MKILKYSDPNPEDELNITAKAQIIDTLERYYQEGELDKTLDFLKNNMHLTPDEITEVMEKIPKHFVQIL